MVKPHGIRGEMQLAPETDFPDRLIELQEAQLVRDGRPTPVRVEAVRRRATGLLIKISGIERPEDVEAWRGAWLAVPRAAAAALPAGRYFVFEIIGMAAVTDGGVPLGEVVEVIRTPANDVFVVRGPRGEVLVPAIASVVLDVDRERRRIIIRPLPGLLDDEG